MGHPLLLEYDNAIEPDDFFIMISFAKNATEADWSLMNNEEETGAFWLNKRIIVEDHPLPSWHQKIIEQRQYIDFSDITEPRKIQRFGIGDSLGPLRDGDHVPQIKYGCVLFLNSPKNAEIVFPDLNYRVSAKANRMVIYPSDILYKIKGSDTGEYLYFSTVFFNLN